MEFHTVRLRTAAHVAERARERWERAWRLRAMLLAMVLVAGAWAASHPGALVEWARRPRPAAVPPDSSAALADLVRQVEESSAAGEHAAVARLCDVIVRSFPDHPVAEPARVRFLQASMECGDVRAAETALADFCRRHPDSPLLPEVLLHVATWQYELGKYADAAQTWTDLIAAATRNGMGAGREDASARPVIVRSLSLWKKLQREERSRTELERLARFNQALSWELAGDGDAALRAYDRFLARFPQNEQAPEARFRLANLLIERGFVDEAVDFYRTVYEDSSANAGFRCESVYRAGRSEEQKRRLENAIEIYGHALDLVPVDHPMRLAALTQLAQLVEQREPTRALAIYRELANTSSRTAVRAVALQRLRVLEGESAGPTAALAPVWSASPGPPPAAPAADVPLASPVTAPAAAGDPPPAEPAAQPAGEAPAGPSTGTATEPSSGAATAPSPGSADNPSSTSTQRPAASPTEPSTPAATEPPHRP